MKENKDDKKAVGTGGVVVLKTKEGELAQATAFSSGTTEKEALDAADWFLNDPITDEDFKSLVSTFAKN